jgi:hypothetical protein
LSASDHTKKIISPEGEFSLPEHTSNEFLCVHIERLRLSGQTTINVVEEFLVIVTN